MEKTTIWIALPCHVCGTVKLQFTSCPGRAKSRLPLNLDRPTVSLNGDAFDSDYEYFKQIPWLLESLEES
jgi:hypothetical protein